MKKKAFDKEDAQTKEAFRLLARKGFMILRYQDECVEIYYPGKPLDGDLYFIYTKQRSKLNRFDPTDKKITSLGDDWYWFWK